VEAVLLAQSPPKNQPWQVPDSATPVVVVQLGSLCSRPTGCPLGGRQLRHSQAPKVRNWLAQRPRFHMHYTPSYASWLNQQTVVPPITEPAALPGLATGLPHYTEAGSLPCALRFCWHSHISK